MTSRKRRMTTDRDVVVEVHHRYPTRWKLRQTSRQEDDAKDQIVVLSKGTREETDTPHLPREMIFNILVYIPAKFLHEVVRYVCKQWYDIVSDPIFVTAHRDSTCAGYVVQELNPQHPCQFDYILGETVDMKVTQFQLPFPARILGSVDGLVLVQDLTNLEIFHVMNPVTKVKISLPPLLVSDQKFTTTGFALDSSGHYKVVHVGRKFHYEQVGMKVFTIGVDKAWRTINLQSNIESMYCLCSVGGLIYWCQYWHNISCGLCITLDVDTETIYQFSEPEGLVKFKDRASLSMISKGMIEGLELITTESGIGLLTIEGEIWRSWNLTDGKTNEWTQGAGINIPALMSRIDKIFHPHLCSSLWPIRVHALRFVDGDFLFLYCDYNSNQGCVLVRYNLANGNIVFSRREIFSSMTRLYPHAHTLLSPKNC